MPAFKELITTRSPDDLRGAIGDIINTHSNGTTRLAAMQIEATLLLVEAVNRLTDEVTKSANAMSWAGTPLGQR